MEMNNNCIDLINQFPELNPSMLDDFSLETLIMAHQKQHNPPPPPPIFQPTSVSTTTTTSHESSRMSHSASAIYQKNQESLGRGKKRMRNDREVDRTEEVVHVRSKRGQATDTHSLAERVRRGKINEKLRCLQELVPGCYKTMGMAVMLDEIISYVHSLQNQIEFLSMELAAANSFYDLNMDKEVIIRKL